MDFLAKYNIDIKNKNLLEEALTHSSFANENKCKDYERLEFLGDAVLQLIISEYLYKNYNLKEGQMSKERSRFVCEDALCHYVKNIGYDSLIKVGHGLIGSDNNAIVADTFESVLAVIYLECGLDKCKEYINEVVIPHIENNDNYFKDYKTSLQELVQTDKKSLEYRLKNSYGEAHDMTFEIDVVVDGIILGSGKGKSKKEAEQNAAKEALKKCAR